MGPMTDNIRKQSLTFLESLIGAPLCYGIKSPDMDLYDFGFGPMINVPSRHNSMREVGTFCLHIICRFKIISKVGERSVNRYYEDTPTEEFHCAIMPLIGLHVKRIAISDKNDLWLDLGDYWIVFVTFENGKESWRFFTFTEDRRYLVAADNWLTLD